MLRIDEILVSGFNVDVLHQARPLYDGLPETPIFEISNQPSNVLQKWNESG